MKLYTLSDTDVTTLSDDGLLAMLRLTRDAFDAFDAQDKLFEREQAHRLAVDLTREQTRRFAAHADQLLLAGVA